MKPPSARHCSNGVAVKATIEVYCLTPHLFLQSLTAQALFTLKIRRARTQIAIPCECLLGEGVLCTQAVKRTLIRSVLINGMCQFADGARAATAASHCSNGVAVEATNEVYCLTPHLFLQSLTAQALFTLKRRRAKTQTTIPCECLLGEAHFVRKRIV